MKQKRKMELMKAVEAVKSGAVPWKIGTLYNWHHKVRFPKLLRKVAGSLMIDLAEYARMANKN